MIALAALHPHLEPLPPGRGATTERVPVEGGLLVLTDPRTDIRKAATAAIGGPADDWRFGHDARGTPVIRSDAASPFVSISNGPGMHALLLGSGPVGVDVESLPRIAANASPDDPWLAASERALIRPMQPADAVLELACRWVLREAYGKALGRGLDLPLDRLAFTPSASRIALPAWADAGWRFALHRCGAVVIGIATRPSDGQPVGAVGQETAGAGG